MAEQQNDQTNHQYGQIFGEIAIFTSKMNGKYTFGLQIVIFIFRTNIHFLIFNEGFFTLPIHKKKEWNWICYFYSNCQKFGHMRTNMHLNILVKKDNNECTKLEFSYLTSGTQKNIIGQIFNGVDLIYMK